MFYSSSSCLGPPQETQVQQSLKSLGHFSSSVLYSTPNLSSRVWLAPLHCYCCSGWSFYGTSIPKLLDFFCCNLPVVSPIGSLQFQAQISLHDLFNPELSTSTEAPSNVAEPAPSGSPGFSWYQASSTFHDLCVDWKENGPQREWYY